MGARVSGRGSSPTYLPTSASLIRAFVARPAELQRVWPSSGSERLLQLDRVLPQVCAGRALLAQSRGGNEGKSGVNVDLHTATMDALVKAGVPRLLMGDHNIRPAEVAEWVADSRLRLDVRAPSEPTYASGVASVILDYLPAVGSIPGASIESQCGGTMPSSRAQTWHNCMHHGSGDSVRKMPQREHTCKGWRLEVEVTLLPREMSPEDLSNQCRSRYSSLRATCSIGYFSN